MLYKKIISCSILFFLPFSFCKKESQIEISKVDNSPAKKSEKFIIKEILNEEKMPHSYNKFY